MKNHKKAWKSSKKRENWWKTIEKHEKAWKTIKNKQKSWKIIKKTKKYEKHEKTCFSCFFWIGGDFCQEQSEILICRALWPPVPPWVAGLGTTSPLRGQCVTEFENPPPPAPSVLGSYMDYVLVPSLLGTCGNVSRHGCVFLLGPPSPSWDMLFIFMFRVCYTFIK